jgi:bifunctional DNA-binding transcriptional regulator/antitoxin component of YhaV-PrlF toxin-antitoxin module
VVDVPSVRRHEQPIPLLARPGQEGEWETVEPLRIAFYMARLSVIRRVKGLQSSGELKEYESYRVTVPREVVEVLGLAAYQPVIVGIAKPRSYHLINPRDPQLPQMLASMGPVQMAELCYLGLLPDSTCRGYRLFTVLASEEELEELGIKPYQLVPLSQLRLKLLRS